VRYADGGRNAPNIALVLTHVDRQTEYQLQTFRDGTFYYYGLPPGNYELRVSPATARKLGYNAELLMFRIAPKRETALDDLTLTLQRAVERDR
jgi:hypothetical protein